MTFVWEIIAEIKFRDRERAFEEIQHTKLIFCCYLSSVNVCSSHFQHQIIYYIQAHKVQLYCFLSMTNRDIQTTAWFYLINFNNFLLTSESLLYILSSNPGSKFSSLLTSSKANCAAGMHAKDKRKLCELLMAPHKICLNLFQFSRK